MSIKSYIAIARPDHWFKNVFVLPGAVVATLLTQTPFSKNIGSLLIGLISICLVASANYVINEWLDAESDRFHPVKKNRPSALGNVRGTYVYLEYCMLAVTGLSIAGTISRSFFIAATILLVMGIFYNVKPFRTKDRVYLDVLSESANNPLRLVLGWFVVTSHPLPPSSLVFGYWMGGAFLMAVKRYAELRFIISTESDGERVAGLYRKSFQDYNEEKLILSIFFYGLSSAFFIGVFLVKYRIELLLSLPFFAILFAWYLHIGMKPNSVTQNPERLYREKRLIAYIVFLLIFVGVLLTIDLPWLDLFLQNAFISL